MTAEQQLEAAKQQLAEAAEMLNEVKQYRGIFYKQKVANWQAENDKIFNPNNKNGNNRNNNQPLFKGL